MFNIPDYLHEQTLQMLAHNCCLPSPKERNLAVMFAKIHVCPQNWSKLYEKRYVRLRLNLQKITFASNTLTQKWKEVIKNYALSCAEFFFSVEKIIHNKVINNCRTCQCHCDNYGPPLLWLRPEELATFVGEWFQHSK